MSKLTTKQELFVQQLVAGQSQRQAYRSAYPSAKKWKDNVVDNKASELLKNGEVSVRYRELLKQFSNMALWSREQAFNEYEWLKNQAKEDNLIRRHHLFRPRSQINLGILIRQNLRRLKR